MTEHLEMEARGALEQVMSLQEPLPEAKWFLNCLYRGFSQKRLPREKPEILLLGEDIPWELTKAAGARTRVILGGSLETTRWSDAMLPRDADPISRSACGWLMNPHFNLAENALVLTALTSDSRRKLTGLMRDNGIHVLAVDLPPMWDRLAWQEAWVDGMARVVRAIEEHTDRTVTRRALAAAIGQHEQVRADIAAFKRASLGASEALSSAMRQLILESFWYAPNTDEWLMRLNRLTAVLRGYARRHIKPAEERPRVLIAGSPVIFPNEKLPLLLESAGLALVDTVDSVSAQLEMPVPKLPRFGGVMGILLEMAQSRLPKDASGAWTVNHGLLDGLKRKLDAQRVDGVVYHVLKGQIELDFELTRVEALCERYGVPVFRLETDYQQQDVEQLRIRMEAFAEMLRQQTMEGLRIAL